MADDSELSPLVINGKNPTRSTEYDVIELNEIITPQNSNNNSQFLAIILIVVLLGLKIGIYSNNCFAAVSVVAITLVLHMNGPTEAIPVQLLSWRKKGLIFTSGECKIFTTLP
jgi:hypothetical protein